MQIDSQPRGFVLGGVGKTRGAGLGFSSMELLYASFATIVIDPVLARDNADGIALAGRNLPKYSQRQVIVREPVDAIAIRSLPPFAPAHTGGHCRFFLYGQT